MTAQNELIEKHLRLGNTITPLEALNLFGCMRLGARIWDLRKKGLDVKERTVNHNGKRYSEYYLQETNNRIGGTI